MDLIKTPDNIGRTSKLLGTAAWMEPGVIAQNFPLSDGKIWIGRDLKTNEPVGFTDDRHVCLISGNRGGKGASIIIPNTILWPGSIVVIDPKGENASVTASRRGTGSKYCDGLGQKVFVLDPFRDASVHDEYRACFNPLDLIDPSSPEASDDASRIADALVVKGDDRDAHWQESARNMIKAIILHIVTTDTIYDQYKTLTTLREFLLEGDQNAVRALKSQKLKVDSSHEVMWNFISRNSALNGLISRLAKSFLDKAKNSKREYNSILSFALRNTEFLDSPGIQDVVSKSDFKLSELKTSDKGVSLFLTLPQRYMGTHSRWLRLMTSMVITEMEKTKGSPATGHPVLMCLDEFAGLQRMEIIENGVAQMAGFGLKFFFVLQDLGQLKAVYSERWESFLGNSSLKVYFAVNDHFTRERVSTEIGTEEIIRTSKSLSDAKGDSTTVTDTESSSTSQSQSRSKTKGHSSQQSVNRSENESHSINSGLSRGNIFKPGELIADAISNSFGGNRVQTWGTGKQRGTSVGAGTNESYSTATSESATQSKSHSTAKGQSYTHTVGENESIHERLLIKPDEVGRWFKRIDDSENAISPGLALALIAGEQPIVVRRSNYFEDRYFDRKYDPHPNHGIGKRLEALSMDFDGTITEETTKKAVEAISSLIPQVDNRRRGTPAIMNEVKRLYPVKDNQAEKFKAERIINMPMEFIWYKVLDFQSYVHWNLGRTKDLPPVPDPVFAGVDLTPEELRGTKDVDGNPYYMTVPECWETDGVNYFSVYTGYLYAFNLSKISETKTRLRFFRYTYLSKSTIIQRIETWFMQRFVKEYSDDSGSELELEKFLKHCSDPKAYPAFIRPWVKSYVASTGKDLI